jgi:predicted lipoprotein with Yx(FWY)xxD motif
MKKFLAPLTVTIALVGLTLSGCSALGGDGYGYESPASPEATAPAETPTNAPTEAPAAEPVAPTVLTLAESALGTITVDGTAMTVYRFDNDTKDSGTSACTDDCAVKWPAVISDSATPVAEGITGTVAANPLPDGTFQVTVNGWPLYRFAKDAAAGDINGQGVGDVWHVVAADGSTITDAAPQAGYDY